MKKIVFTLIGVTALLAGCGKSLEKDVVGKWAYEMNMPMDDNESSGQATIKCVSEFFPNKSVNHDCELKVTLNLKEGNTKIEMDAQAKATGDWSVTDKTLFDKTIDGKVELTKLRVDGEEISDKKVLEDTTKDIQNPFMKGETTSSITTFFDGKKWVFDQEIEKKKVSITAVRK
jgi:hypothetical protein